MGKRYGIIADVHSNIESLKSVLAELEKEGVDEILCLGDVVGYNASPSECIDIVFETCSRTIRGNHDRFILGELPDGLREAIVHVAQWGRENISDEQASTLADCPDTEVIDDLFLIVHGSPRNRDEYLLTQETIQKNLNIMKSKFAGLDVCFYGHTHIPCLVGNNEISVEFKERKTVQLERLTTYLINPGSSGQPRDGCALAACGIFDSDEWTMTYLRVEYDIKSTQDKVSAAGLDPWFADRLEIGR